MKSILLLAGLLGTSIPAWATNNCSLLLGISSRFSAQFAKYDRLEYLPHLRLADFEKPTPESFNFSIYAPRPNDGAMVDMGATLNGYFSDQAHTKLTVTKIEIDAILPPEFSLRVIWAHVLNEYPKVKSITWEVYASPEEGIVVEGMLEGLSPENAVQRSNYYRALAAFGFEVEAVRAPLQAPEDALIFGETALTIVMKRLTRRPRST